MKNLILLMIAVFMTACNENEIWKQPMDVVFYLTINPQGSNGGPGDLTFNEGYISLANVTLTGEIENADNFTFQREYPGGLKIPFMHTNEVQELKFSMPQGRYTKLNLSFETYEFINQENIYVAGVFVYNNPNKDPALVMLSVNTPNSFNIDVTDENGNQSFDLIDGDFKNPEIILNPPFWFKNITASIMNGSNTTVVNNQSVITINNSENANIYNSVEPRIGGDARSVIKKK